MTLGGALRLPYFFVERVRKRFVPLTFDPLLSTPYT